MKNMKKNEKESISKELLGKEITLLGEVVNCKAGPCIKIKDGTVIYVQELNEELIGKRIQITGMFLREKLIPDPKVSENGAISTGAYGEQYILENIKNIKIN